MDHYGVSRSIFPKGNKDEFDYGPPNEKAEISRDHHIAAFMDDPPVAVGSLELEDTAIDGIGYRQMEISGFSSLPPREVHRHAARVHLALLDQFVLLTKHARNESSSEFLRESLNDQIKWLSILKSRYAA